MSATENTNNMQTDSHTPSQQTQGQEVS